MPVTNPDGTYFGGIGPGQSPVATPPAPPQPGPGDGPGAMPPPPVGSPGGAMPTAPQWGQGNPWSPWSQLPGPQQPGFAPPPSSGGGMPAPPGYPGYSDGSSYGGQTTVNPQAGAADYDSVRGFTDQAYEQAMRHIQPQMDQQNRRFDQQLINQGIDPNSAAGQEARAQLDRGQNDLQSKASFDALQFGQNIQNQMFGQDATRAGLAGQMQMGDWANTTARSNLLGNVYGSQLGYLGNIYGADMGYATSLNNNMTQRYLGDQSYNLGMGNLELGRQRQDWGEMMDMERNNQWSSNFNRQGDWRNQDLILSLLGQQIPNQPQGGINPGQAGNPFAPWADWGAGMLDTWGSNVPQGGGG